MANKSLLLTVDATVDPLERAVRTGKVVLADLGKSAGDAAREVQEKLRSIASDPGPVVESLQKSLAAQISAARRAASAAIADAGGGGTAASSLAAAEAIEKLARAERSRSEAAIRATAADERQAAGLRVVAVSAASAAEALDQQALALRDQAAIYAAVEVEQGGLITSSKAVAGTSAAMRAGFQQAGFQISDFAVQVGGGTSAIRAASLQAPQLIQAIALMGGETEGSTSKLAKFAGFMGGPWGAAITVGISILGALATSYFDTGEATDKAEAGTFDFSKSLDFLVLKADAAQAAIKQLVGETERLLKIEGDFSKQVAANANTALSQGQTRVANAKSAVEKLESAPASGPGGLGQYIFNIGAAREELRKAQEFVRDATKAADNAALALSQQAVIDSRDKFGAQLTQIKREVGTLETNRRASIDVERLDPRVRTYELKKRQAIYVSDAEYRAELARLEGLREAVEKAKAKAKETPRSTAGSPSDDNALGGTVALLKQLLPGVQITSTTGGKHVKGSDHYAGRGIDFVPAGGMSSISWEDMKQRIEDAGITIRRNANGTQQFFGPGHYARKPGDHDDHFHLGFQGSPSPEAADRIARQRDEKASRDREALEGAMLASRQEQARLARLGVTDAVKLAALDAAEIDAALERKLAQNAKLDLDHRDLDALDRANAATEKRAIAEKLRAELTEEALRKERDGLDLEAQLLELQGALAVSLKERKANAKALLGNWRDQELNSSAQQYARDGNLEDLLDRDGATRAVFDARGKSLDQQFRGPIGDYRADLRKNVGDIDEALEGVGARGLQNLEDGLVGIISGTESVAGAFKKMAAAIIADLARIAIQKAILSVIALKTGDVPAHATGMIPGFAGGIISGPGTGTSDSILAWHQSKGLIRVSNGESIITAEGTRKHRRLLKAINDNTLPSFASGMIGEVSYPHLPTARSLRSGGFTNVQQFDLRGAIVTEDLYRDMHQIGASYAARALAAAPALTREQQADDAAQRIPL